MHREQRLRRRKDFAAAYRSGRAVGNHLLVIRVRPNGSAATRFGFVTGKVIGGAVVRNRVKRRLREAASTIEAAPGFDIVVGARKPAATADYQALQRALIALMHRSHVVHDGSASAQENA